MFKTLSTTAGAIALTTVMATSAFAQEGPGEGEGRVTGILFGGCAGNCILVTEQVDDNT